MTAVELISAALTEHRFDDSMPDEVFCHERGDSPMVGIKRGVTPQDDWEEWVEHVAPIVAAAVNLTEVNPYMPAAMPLARRLVAVTLAMKRQYQDAGMMVARTYCEQHGIDVYAIERELRQAGTSSGSAGQVDAFAAAKVHGPVVFTRATTVEVTAWPGPIDAVNRYLYVLRVEWRGGDTWCVTDGFGCYRADGTRESEPIPSSRDDAFISRTRFTFDDARELAERIAPTMRAGGGLTRPSMTAAEMWEWEKNR